MTTMRTAMLTLLICSVMGCQPQGKATTTPSTVASVQQPAPTPSPAPAPAPAPAPSPAPTPMPAARPSNSVNLPVASKTNSAIGVDVYEGQGTINWSQVVATGRTFAYVKATEGLTITDSQFKKNWAAQNLLYMGAYHFLHAQDSGAAQAAHFMSVVGAITPGQNFPPIVDVETLGFDGQSNATIIKVLQDYLNAIQTATGMRPMIYTDRGSWNSLGSPTQFSGYPLIIAAVQTAEAEVPPPWSSWLMWQYSWTGTVTGIPNKVDEDIFYGTQAQLQAFIQSNGLILP